MNGKFDKKKVLKQIEKNRKGAKKLVEDSIKDAKKILKKEGLAGYDSFPLAVVGLAEALFRVEAKTLQAKAQVEQAEVMQKAADEARKRQKSCESCQKKPSKTPVA